MRTSFINQLIQEARVNERIFLVVGDLGFSVVEPFAEEFPNRFLNAGVAEQNMTGLAAGLAKEGYNVFTYSIGNFPTLRPMEQIRYDVCYHNLSVKIVAVGGGFAYGPLGASHHATEELGMLRVLPNITVCAPGDPFEAKAVTTFLAGYKGPAYLRLGKADEPNVHKDQMKLNRGDCLEILKGEDVVVFSTGAMLKYVFDEITNKDLGWGLYSFPFVKPVNSEQLLAVTKKYKKIITIEEHQRSGGFGSAILESVNDLSEKNLLEKIPRIERIAIPDKFFSIAGSQNQLRKTAGLILTNCK